MSKRIRVTLVVLMMLASQTILAAQDYLECDLSNGDKFILINKYDYSAMAKFTRHGASRINQSGFNGFYQKSGNGLEKSPSVWMSASPNDLDVNRYHQREFLCVRFNIYNLDKAHNFPVSAYKSIRFFFGKYRWLLSDEQEKTLNAAKVTTQEGQDSRLKLQKEYERLIAIQYGVDANSLSGYSLLGKAGEVIWAELSFESKNATCITTSNGTNSTCPIFAVWQTQSTDNGQTWSDPIITKDAKLFVIGKSILDQPAVAKPGKWKKGPG